MDGTNIVEMLGGWQSSLGSEIFFSLDDGASATSCMFNYHVTYCLPQSLSVALPQSLSPSVSLVDVVV